MTTDRFNPEPDVIYGHCLECPTELHSPEDAAEHRRASRCEETPYGHQTRRVNPTRDERVRDAVASIVTDAIDRAALDLFRLVTKDHVTAKEVTEALRVEDDTFQLAWKEAILANPLS